MRKENNCGFDGDVRSEKYCPNNSWYNPVGCPEKCIDCPCDKCEYCVCERDYGQ